MGEHTPYIHIYSRHCVYYRNSICNEVTILQMGTFPKVTWIVNIEIEKETQTWLMYHLIFFYMNLSIFYTCFSPLFSLILLSLIFLLSSTVCQPIKVSKLYLQKVCTSNGYLLCLHEFYFSLGSLSSSKIKPVKQVFTHKSRNLCVELLFAQLIASICSTKIILYYSTR